MSIFTNIDGSVGGANQLFDLLSVVSNPAVYEAKLKALQDATVENQKFIELAGPASDILSLRDQLRDQKQAFDAEVQAAKDQIAKELVDANAEAAQISANAKIQADAVLQNAKQIEAQANAKLSDVLSAQKSADQAQANAEALSVKYQSEIKNLQQAMQENLDAQNAFESAKADLLAKHQAFIESL